MPSVYIRVRERLDHVVVSVCDEKLLGRTLSEGKIKFNVNEEFYGGDLVDVDTCLRHLKNATIANMVGTDSVEAAIEAGYVHKNAVIYIEGHPHAQWVKL
ncbi:DUF424 family protein [Candidatus Thorarchaeota archaeon]|nr:MAG: DUF424 family protein [Candidatus Thorarchaeota archaeon]